MISRASLIAACLVTATMTASAQPTTGVISGRVTDQQDLPLPGATVIVTSSALQGERTVATDEIGAYIIRGLPPGDYTVHFQFTGTSDVTEMVNVPLGGVADVNATLRLAALKEAIQVVADVTPPALAVTQTATNFEADMINALPIGRRPFEIAELAPGLTDNTPNIGQLSVGGAFAYDSLFLVDGVDTNDNLFGTSGTTTSPGLYIEDAILETQVLTAGVSAEYGRFSGGLVNVITKSGGNEFSGSIRTTVGKPSWTVETPFQRSRNQQNSDTLSKYFEGTIGGPIVRDRLWFFNADRYENAVVTRTLAEVGTAYENTVNNKRVELKLTGTPIVNHTVGGSFVNSPISETGRPAINQDMSMDPATLVSRESPQRLWVVNWSGVLSSRLFATAQWSKKDWSNAGGGTSTDIIDSPFISPGSFGIGASPSRHYNAPYFSSLDPEERNNRQLSGSLSYYATHPWVGRHDVKVGGEYFTSFRSGGGSQSATGYVFISDYQVGADGRPVIDAAGHPVPVWAPSATGARTRIQQWIASPGATLYINTMSFYVQDRWQANHRVTADIGVRFENVGSDATGDIVGADTRTWLPRLGVSVDLDGNGQTVAQATYGRYSGRFTERSFGRNTNVATPSRVDLAYVGPAGAGRDFAPGFDLTNYRIVGGNFPTANVFFEDGLTSPKTNEFTLSLGRELPRSGHAKVTYIWRNTSDIFEDFIDDPTDAGKVTVVHEGTNFGTFDRVVFSNSDEPDREYQALQFEAQARALNGPPIQGHYTVQLRNHGSFEGEAANQPGSPSAWHNYPEMFPIDRYDPYGRLDEFQRHKFRLWTTYTQALGRAGSVEVSPIWRVNSGLTYSHQTQNIAMSAAQMALNPGYARANTARGTLFYGERGTENFAGYGVMDLSFRYGVPVWRTVQPWIQAQVFNVFNNQKLIKWDTTVTPDPNSPLDEFGQPTAFIKGPQYGQGTANTHYPAWSTGETGGRTFRLAMGVRF